MTSTRQLFLDYWQEEHGGTPPSHWEICSYCRGNGTSTRYLGAYTESDRAEMGPDWDDFIEDYQRGVYDRACDECDGSGKILAFDDGPAADEFAEWERDAYEDMATRRAESGYSW